MSFSLLPITAWHWKCWATNWKKAHRIQRKMKLLLKKKERKKLPVAFYTLPLLE